MVAVHVDEEMNSSSLAHSIAHTLSLRVGKK